MSQRGGGPERATSHNTRCYAIRCPVAAGHSVGEDSGPAPRGLALRRSKNRPRSMPPQAAARSGPRRAEAVGGHGHPGPPSAGARPHGEAWRGGCRAAAVIRLGVGHGNADGPCAAAGDASDQRERAFRGPAHAGPRSGGAFLLPTRLIARIESSDVMSHAASLASQQLDRSSIFPPHARPP